VRGPSDGARTIDVTPEHRPDMRCFGDAIVRRLTPFLLRAPFLTVAEGPVSCARGRY
jgi:hypothetical protein